jgi:hypothetical protein
VLMNSVATGCVLAGHGRVPDWMRRRQAIAR